MTELKPDLTKRVMFILHWGLVEARNLALCEKNQQIHDLADALETLPDELMNWKNDSLEAIRFNLQTYQDKYQGESYDYLKYLGEEKPPEIF
jgi:hypothetical protein